MPTENTQTPDNQKAKSANKFSLVENRSTFINLVAGSIIVISASILVSLVIMAWINVGTPDPQFRNIKDLISILLPVIGTWMGTILAFYFSKENFEAANQRVKELVDQMNPTDEKLQTLKVSDVMVKPVDATLLILKDEAEFKAQTLEDLVKKMDESHSERLPILQATTLKFIFLIYRTTIERFLLGYSNGSVKLSVAKAPPPGAGNLTVDDMFQSDYKLIKEIVDMNTKQCFLALTTTLDKVKQAMQDNAICQDVFITKTGNKDEAVEGWITNNMIIEKAELFKNVGTNI